MKEKVINIEGKNYKVKDTTSLADKYAISDIIAESCIIKDSNGLCYEDSLKREMYTNICLIKFYTDYTLPDIVDEVFYEKFEKEGIFLSIKLFVYDDLKLINKQVDNLVNYKVHTCQSLEYIVTDKFNKLLAKVPELSDWNLILNQLTDSINKMDKDKLKIVVDTLQKNKVKKELKKDNDKVN